MVFVSHHPYLFLGRLLTIVLCYKQALDRGFIKDVEASEVIPARLRPPDVDPRLFPNEFTENLPLIAVSRTKEI